jgi:hypothetical protein
MRCIFFPAFDTEKNKKIEEENGSIFLILYIIVLVKNNVD